MTPSNRRRSEGLIDLSGRRRIHVVGVGGPGMSALALLLARQGHDVTGSDVRESDVTAQLRREGVGVSVGHDASLVDGVDVVAYSTAIPADNIEIVAARAAGTAVRHRADVLASVCARSRAVGVAGTHGKTTTTALLDHGFTRLGVGHSALVGAELVGSGVGVTCGPGDLFVLEADESDGTLDVLPLRGIVVTNLDADHLDYFGSFDDMQSAFVGILGSVEGPIVLNIDDEHCAPLRDSGPGKRARTFGTGSGADVRVSDVEPTPDGIDIALVVDGAEIRGTVPLRGVHNAMNVAAATAMADALGVDAGAYLASLADYPGVSRRFTERGSVHGALLVDDYAHLPAEIAAAVSAMRTHPAVTGRIVAVFQPNRYHRIAKMSGDYADCFTGADSVVITDIYASGTSPIEGVTGRLVHDAVAVAHPDADVVWAPTRADVVAAVLARLAPGDGCISMGCGDIETLPDDLSWMAT